MSGDEEAEDRSLRTELAELRKGAGPTRAKLKTSTTLLRALRTDDPGVALDRLKAEVARLGDGEMVGALKAAYAMGPHRDRFLEKRRAAYGSTLDPERQPLAIKAWEEEMLDELAEVISRPANRASIDNAVCYLQGFVEDRRIMQVYIEYVVDGKVFPPLSQALLSADHPQTGASLNAVMMRPPAEIELVELFASVDFQGDQPTTCWAFEANDDLLGVMFSALGLPVQLEAAGASCHFPTIFHSLTYGIAWSFD